MEIEDYMDEEWKFYLDDEFKKEYYIRIKETLREQDYLPEKPKIFEFSHNLKMDNIKVVLIGQDPYQRSFEATGLAFSSSKDYNKIPNCCRTFYRAIKKDYPDYNWPKTGCLEKWVDQGVLLLNDTLTVMKNKPGSHFYLNWSRFTNQIVHIISERLNGVVFVLLGSKARAKRNFINSEKHFIIESVHPSHYHAEKFINSHVFKRINEFLKKKEKEEIVW